MKFILLHVRVASIVHGFEGRQPIVEECPDEEWCDKLLAIDRILSATQQHLLVTGSHGRVMYWEYEGGLSNFEKRLDAAGLTLPGREIA